MASITGDSSNIFINNGDLRLARGVYAASLTLTSEDPFSFGSNIIITQTGTRIAIGGDAGVDNQGEDTVAIGGAAGYNSQSGGAVAIGNYAGKDHQGENSVAIGVSAGQTSQNSYAIAIGSGAGSENQGFQSIAIGRLAGNTDQHANTIVLNATGTALKTDQEEFARYLCNTVLDLLVSLADRVVYVNFKSGYLHVGQGRYAVITPSAKDIIHCS